MRSKSNSLTRYFPTDKFHIIPVTDLTPDAIRRSAKSAKLDLEKKFGIVARQNAIAKHLGIKGGFAGYQKEFEDQLLPFMEKHGLQKRTNLITPRYSLPIIHLTPSQVAGRLFLSDYPLPTRIFTGYNVDWEKNNEKFHSLQNPWTRANTRTAQLLFQDLCNALENPASFFPFTVEDLRNAALEDQRHIIEQHWNNLLGPQLLEFDQKENFPEEPIPTIYFSKDRAEQEVQKLQNHCFNGLLIFELWRRSQNRGWVEILPYNNNLIFLIGENGEYDFLFPNLKERPFNHDVYKPRLRNEDLCKSMDSYHFSRWKYFEYTGWEEFDCHEAEKYHYQKCGTPQNHPGFDEYLRVYLMDTGIYLPPVKKSAGEDGFTLCQWQDKKLYVSDLITIDQFHKFMNNNPEYCEYSRRSPENSNVDQWQPNNSIKDGDLPAAATWYDAVAYAAWISKTRKLPVRLLTEQEYLHLASPRQPMTSEGFWQSSASYQKAPLLCQFYLNDINPTENCFAASDPNCTLRYLPESIEWTTNEQGVRFLTSTYFGEWLALQSRSINTKTLCGLLDPGASPYRAPFTSDSTGRYKRMKVGFRLCFLSE